MRMYDIIEKKRYNRELTKEEIEFFVRGFSRGDIPDYQVSALLMAICINGLTKEELVHLTFAMSNSSGRLDLSSLKIPGRYIVDKHSTGGVGDKVTLIVLPIVASLGVEVCKMSGKGLGYTGGTADKLEAIEGYNVNLSLEDAIEQVKDIGVCLISQSSDIAIADKKMYALRDTTATVESIELIASSIMSKKLASGVDKILLDVTVGSGAFMKNINDAKKLARTMVDIGNLAGVETKAIITSMSEPLGKSVGNALEIKEVIEFLLSNEETLYSSKSKDLKEVVFEIAAYMIKMAGLGNDIEQNKRDVFRAIVSGKAYEKFIELISAQNGQVCDVYMDWIEKELPMPVLKDNANYLKEIHAQNTGIIVAIDSKKIGEALVCIGGGRIKKDDDIDYAVGFEFVKKTGDFVNAGDTILKVIYNDKEKFDIAFEYIEDAIVIENVLPQEVKYKSHILDIVE